MKIKTKIFALIGALAAVTITVAGVGIETLKEYNASVENVKNSAGRALYSERLNRLVTAVVMDSRGIYASGDTKEAKKFADGVKGSLADIDALLKRWEPLVLPEDRALFDAVVSDAASFKSFRTETARLGTEVSPEAANTQGNNDANRANRKKFQASIDALTTRSQEQVTQVEKAAAALYDERLLLLMVLALGGTAAALVLGGVVGHRQIARPLQLVTSAIERLAAGDYNLVQARHGRDEIGDIWKSMGVFASTMKEAERLRAAQTENELEVAQRRKDEMAELASRFEGSVGSLVQHLSTAAQELEATAQSMATTANQTNQQSSSVAAAAEETSVNVQAVASATEELAASAGEIGSQVLQTSHVAKEAVEKARRTDERVQVLAEGAQKVGQVIALINQIAAQTNLLALNATIEAARAGEAGKGFAVVASEVKELANQTARATDDITAQIAEIQTATSDAVESIREIGATIAEMHQIATSVAAAVEQQKAATHEIARNVSEAARGTQEVTQNIVQVQGASTHSGAAAAQVLTAASEMARNSTQLAREVDAFLGNVRAA